MKDKLFYSICLWISYFYLSLSEIPNWTHQRQFGLVWLVSKFHKSGGSL
jgi:hypothetical protein